MRPSSSLRSRAAKLALSLLLASQSVWRTNAFSFTSIPSPNLDIGSLGRVAFAGDFDSVSLYQFEGQNENTAGPNGALLSRFPNGLFANLSQTDGEIKAMCDFQQNGTLVGVVFGGNFTGVGGVQTSGGIALLNVTDGSVSALPGLNGSVNALFCDHAGGRVYIGGSFTGGGATNAIVWITGWTNMPFSGFNGPVNTISQAPNGKIIFGGEFNALGGNSSAPRENNTQVLPIGSANLTTQASSTTAGLSNPANIVCKTGQSQGVNDTWLLADDSPGFWQATFGFGFEPTLLRLYNTDLDGRGTKTWRYTALPDGGIMNFSYVDPSSGQKKFCDARCPLPQNNVSAQDFTFVNNVGMNTFQLDISDWYGQGGGLNGIELFQNNVFSYAVNEFNEPKCGGVTTGAVSTTTGPWSVTPSHNSNSEYLTATLTGDDQNPNQTFIVFQPDVPQSGDYIIQMYTPGCQGDNTCQQRGIVNVTGSMSKSDSASKPLSTQLFQTNDFDKYDEIYSGYVEATDGFRPSITLAPVPDQAKPTLVVVAQRIGFVIRSASSGELNGIFEYDPTQQTVTNDFTNSVIDAAGAALAPTNDAIITSLSNDSSRLFVGGNFSGDGFSNFFAINDTSAVALPGAGLDNQVMTMYNNGSTIFVGGNFTKTSNSDTLNLNGVAAFSITSNTWSALGAGVNGVVMFIVPFSLNLTANSPETVLGISGFFDQVNGFQNNQSFAVDNFAVWVPSRSNWLQNLEIGALSVEGSLTAFTDIPGADPVFGGAVNSQLLGASGSVQLESGNPLSLGTLPASIRAQQQQQSSLQKRASAGERNDTTTGIITATFYHENNMNKTILAGHFAATDSNGQNVTNLVIIDGKNNNNVSGLTSGVDTNSTFQALAVLSNNNNNLLFAGGAVTGTVNNNQVSGLIAYDLGSNSFAGSQPPGLQGSNVSVNAIAPRPKSDDVYVAGSFSTAGSLSCAALCIWNTDRNQWTSPGGDLAGEVTSITWISDTKLLVAGNLTYGNNQTKIVTYDSSKNAFQDFTGASGLPGPVTAMSAANSDGSQIWATGQNPDGSAYLERFNGNKWLSVTNLFGQGTIIRGLQVLTLSKAHAKSEFIDSDQALLILGQVNVTSFGGTASGVLYNGSTLQPFLLSTNSQNTAGSLSQVFVENPQSFFKSSGHHLALGFVVLIALAIALALTFLLVVAGILVEWYRKKSKGYMPAPTHYADRSGPQTSRIPPEHLFGTLQGNRAPAI